MQAAHARAVIYLCRGGVVFFGGFLCCMGFGGREVGGVERGKRRVSWPCTSWNAHDARLVLLALSCSPCAARLACYSLRRGTARTDAVTGVVTKNGAPAPGESRERQTTAVFPLPSRWSHPDVAETRLSCIDSRALGHSSPLLRDRNTLPAHHPANSSSIPPRTALLHRRGARPARQCGAATRPGWPPPRTQGWPWPSGSRGSRSWKRLRRGARQ